MKTHTTAALLCSLFASTASWSGADETPIAVEELTFQVDTAARDRFVELDDAIWTRHLAEQAGFLRKEVWLGRVDSASGKATVKLIIHWRSKAAWDAVPRAGLEATDRRFAKAMKEIGDYRMVSSKAYELATRTSVKQPPSLDVAALATDPVWLSQAEEINVPRTPNFGPNRRYLAVRLIDALRGAVELDSFDPQKTTLVFHCVDGYEPKMPLATALEHEGWIALKDLDLAEGDPWRVDEPGREPASAEPAYLVWPEAPRGVKLAWPYALTEVRLVVDPSAR